MDTIFNERSPQSSFLGLAPFLHLSLQGRNLMPLAQQILQQLEEDLDNPELLMNLYMLLQILNDPKLGLEIQKQALALKRTYILPPAVKPVKYRLLLIMAPGDVAENTPLDCLMEGEPVELIFYYLNDKAPWFIDPIPEHDVAMVGVCESAQHGSMLDELSALMKDWSKPIINKPEFIGSTDRTRASQLLNGVSGIEAPMTFLVQQKTLLALALGNTEVLADFDGTDFPLIVRPRDSHAGRDLEKIDSCDALLDYMANVNSKEFFICNFVDYSDAQGNFKKFRVALIEGKAYICHKAISKHWMIHYLNAGMMEDETKRQEEAKSMERFDEFVNRHAEALGAIYDKTKMDYLGIDCGETVDGRLLIFEIDHVMVIHGMDPIEMFPYKQKHIQKIRDAFNKMVENRISH